MGSGKRVFFSARTVELADIPHDANDISSQSTRPQYTRSSTQTVKTYVSSCCMMWTAQPTQKHVSSDGPTAAILT